MILTLGCSSCRVAALEVFIRVAHNFNGVLEVILVYLGQAMRH